MQSLLVGKGLPSIPLETTISRILCVHYQAWISNKKNFIKCKQGSVPLLDKPIGGVPVGVRKLLSKYNGVSRTEVDNYTLSG